AGAARRPKALQPARRALPSGPGTPATLVRNSRKPGGPPDRPRRRNGPRQARARSAPRSGSPASRRRLPPAAGQDRARWAYPRRKVQAPLRRPRGRAARADGPEGGSPRRYQAWPLRPSTHERPAALREPGRRSRLRGWRPPSVLSPGHGEEFHASGGDLRAPPLVVLAKRAGKGPEDLLVHLGRELPSLPQRIYDG